MLSDQWKQKKRDFLKSLLTDKSAIDDSFLKVDEPENQNKTYAAGTPWTTLIKDSSLVNSRVFVREIITIMTFSLQRVRKGTLYCHVLLKRLHTLSAKIPIEIIMKYMML